VDEKLQGDFSGQLRLCFSFSELPRKKEKRRRKKENINITNLLFIIKGGKK
jgi:hypothetical protein